MKKYILLYFSLFFAFGLVMRGQAQTHKISFHVSGICGMCKERIEHALDFKGIKFASWDVETQQCEVVYKPGKISEDEIHQLLANIGHDTDRIQAPDKAYDTVHGCCKFRTMESDPDCDGMGHDKSGNARDGGGRKHELAPGDDHGNEAGNGHEDHGNPAKEHKGDQTDPR